MKVGRMIRVHNGRLDCHCRPHDSTIRSKEPPFHSQMLSRQSPALVYAILVTLEAMPGMILYVWLNYIEKLENTKKTFASNSIINYDWLKYIERWTTKNLCSIPLSYDWLNYIEKWKTQKPTKNLCIIPLSYDWLNYIEKWKTQKPLHYYSLYINWKETNFKQLKKEDWNERFIWVGTK